MSQKLNCWEFKNCGREPGGVMAKQLGVCPVALARQHDGVNGGQAAGRVCWCIKETGNRLARTLDTQHNGCQNCHFFQRVTFEEQTEAKGRLTLTNV